MLLISLIIFIGLNASFASEEDEDGAVCPLPPHISSTTMPANSSPIDTTNNQESNIDQNINKTDTSKVESASTSADSIKKNSDNNDTSKAATSDSIKINEDKSTIVNSKNETIPARDRVEVIDKPNQEKDNWENDSLYEDKTTEDLKNQRKKNLNTPNKNTTADNPTEVNSLKTPDDKPKSSSTKNKKKFKGYNATLG